MWAADLLFEFATLVVLVQDKGRGSFEGRMWICLFLTLDLDVHWEDGILDFEKPMGHVPSGAPVSNQKPTGARQGQGQGHEEVSAGPAGAAGAVVESGKSLLPVAREKGSRRRGLGVGWGGRGKRANQLTSFRTYGSVFWGGGAVVFHLVSSSIHQNKRQTHKCPRSARWG